MGPVGRKGGAAMAGKAQLRRAKVGACGTDQSGQPCVVLETRTRALVVPVGAVHAQNIALLHAGEKPERPFTHHAFADMLGAFNVHAEAVEIDRVEDGIFGATLRLRRGQRMRRALEVPAGDAIALAVHQHCPVLVAEAVLRAAAVRKPDAPASSITAQPLPLRAPVSRGLSMPGLLVARALELRATRTEIHATRRGITTTQVTRRGKRSDIWLPQKGWRDLLLGICELAGIPFALDPGERSLPQGRLRGEILIRTGTRRMVGNVEIDSRRSGGDIVITYADPS